MEFFQLVGDEARVHDEFARGAADGGAGVGEVGVDGGGVGGYSEGFEARLEVRVFGPVGAVGDLLVVEGEAGCGERG